MGDELVIVVVDAAGAGVVAAGGALDGLGDDVDFIEDDVFGFGVVLVDLDLVGHGGGFLAWLFLGVEILLLFLLSSFFLFFLFFFFGPIEVLRGQSLGKWASTS